MTLANWFSQYYLWLIVACLFLALLRWHKPLLKLKWFVHCTIIFEQPSKFLLWVLMSIVLSLSSIWLPGVLGLLIDRPFFAEILKNNPVIIFSIVFISNSVLSAFNLANAGTKDFAVTLRSIVLVITIIYLILLSAIIPMKLLINHSLSLQQQMGFLTATILLGCYVYGFRHTEWESSLSEYPAQQNENVNDLQQGASDINNAGGIKL